MMSQAEQQRRSIPAPAGEPQVVELVGQRDPVYPRACGGTRSSVMMVSTCRGLSPRLRGNRADRQPSGMSNGSIPAPAGEPSPPLHQMILDWAYPRACGGTFISCPCISLANGLSPRLRGNRTATTCSMRLKRPIPAPAGEPRNQLVIELAQGAYPRACGGTAAWQVICPTPTGLSPRLRGNPALAGMNDCTRGSIPAPAGEPDSGNAHTASHMVYPRACGGTAQWMTERGDNHGLSPRLRGNHHTVPKGRHTDLSPRLRGNRVGTLLWMGRRRSIPAPAGEPLPLPMASP